MTAKQDSSPPIYNFSSGPAVLPREVLEEVQRDLVELPEVGMSVLEISHRSPWADQIFAEVEGNVRELMDLPAEYRVLFLQGGGNLQFSMVPINFLGREASADYVLTGHWGRKAVQEARREGDARIAWSGEPDGFRSLPGAGDLDLDPNASYLHFTSNETIQGVQFGTDVPASWPTGSVPVVCDASSDFLSRPIEIEPYALLYACAQKNAGPSGLTVVVARDDFLESRRDGLHSMLDYQRHAAAGSRLNTPPMFAVYVFLLVTRWLQRQGGLAGMQRANVAKADLLYATLDEHADYYQMHAREECRSQMNVTFRTPDESTDRRFLEHAAQRHLHQLNGHRSVGGIRASIYNAMPRAGVEALCELIRDFRRSA